MGSPSAARLLNAAEEGELNPSRRPTHLIRALWRLVSRAHSLPCRASLRGRAHAALEPHGAGRPGPARRSRGPGSPAAFSTFFPLLSHRDVPCQSLHPSPGRARGPAWLRAGWHPQCRGNLGLGWNSCCPLGQSWARSHAVSAPSTATPSTQDPAGSSFRPEQPGDGVCILRHRRCVQPRSPPAASCLGSRRPTLSKSAAVLPATSPCWEPARPLLGVTCAAPRPHRARQEPQPPGTGCWQKRP